MSQAGYICRLFCRIAPRYDRMNRIMSFGQDLKWRRLTARWVVSGGEQVLDVGTGTGDLALALAQEVGPTGEVVGVDFCSHMLDLAQQKVQGSTLNTRCRFFEGDAMQLPFPNESFDVVTMGFTLRNLPDYSQALQEAHRVLRPGGKIAVLDLGRPPLLPLRLLYYLAFFLVAPLVGVFNRGNVSAYFYLPRSLMSYPPQDQLASLLQAAGFLGVEYKNLSGGIVCVHRGFKAR